MTDVSVVLPTYNEAATIAPVVSNVRDTLTTFDHEVIVADDDSPDGTLEIVDERWGDEPDVVTLRRTTNPGLAPAVIDAWSHARGEKLVVMDADGQHPATKIRTLLVGLEHSDVVVGSRRVEGGGRDDDAFGLGRAVVSAGATALAKLAVPRARGLHDPMSGMFAVRADIVDAIVTDANPTGFKILLEVLARADVRVHESPIHFASRQGGESNFDVVEALRYLRHLGRLAIAARTTSRQTTTAQAVASEGGLRE